jgi:hypothetical protein
LSKPEYNPTSIKFKIQLAAYYHIPEIIIYKLANAPLYPGSEYNFVLKIANPTQHDTTVQFMDLDQFFEVRLGPVNQANGRSEFEDGLGSGYSYHMSVRTRLPDHTMQTKFQSQRPSDVETPVPSI